MTLHLQCKKDGTVRAMLVKYQGETPICLVSRLLTDENAKRIYEAFFSKAQIDKICVRVWVRGLNWVNPQDA